MTIIKSYAEPVEIDGRGKKMEYCGRICYGSADKITSNSHEKFLAKITESGHTSVLEHERVVFWLTSDIGCYRLSTDDTKFLNMTRGYHGIYVSGNVRAWYNVADNTSLFYPFLKELYPYIFTSDELLYGKSVDINVVDGIDSTESTSDNDWKYHDSRTFKIICSRAASHQLVRHRAFSFSQQSQRYVNYAAEKNGRDIKFILPVIDDVKEFTESEKKIFDGNFRDMFSEAENDYFKLVDSGLRPEDARAVLPNATATILTMTGTTADWEKFFESRCDAHAQREIRDLACSIRESIEK